MDARRRLLVAALVGTLGLSACGTASDGDATPTTEAPAVDVSATDTEAPSSTADAPPVATDAPPPAQPEDKSSDTEPPLDDPVPDNTVPASTAPASTPPVAELGGRALVSELSSASDIQTNVLPDLQVDDVRRGAKVNLRNVFPASRPVLIWMWAPH